MSCISYSAFLVQLLFASWIEILELKFNEKIIFFLSRNQMGWIGKFVKIKSNNRETWITWLQIYVSRVIYLLLLILFLLDATWAIR